MTSVLFPRGSLTLPHGVLHPAAGQSADKLQLDMAIVLP